MTYRGVNAHVDTVIGLFKTEVIHRDGPWRGFEDVEMATLEWVANALAETVIGLFKTEVIHRDGPWRGFEDVEMATLEWVAWFNQERLLAPLGYVPPAEFEAQYYDTHHTHTSVGVLN